MDIYQSSWKNIVMPTQIKSRKNLLGPTERKVNGVNILRKDLQIVNRNNKKISAYIFYSPQIQPQHTIMYLHGNGGNKIQALPLIPLIPKFKMNVVSFDFLGCGSSDPDVLSYGINQVFDIRDTLHQVRKYAQINRVTLWGRSMGALCAIMFAQMYSYQVNGLILDSPFRSLSTVIDRIAAKTVSIPEFLLTPVLYFIKKRAAKQVNYDIFSIDYLSIFKKLNTNMPILFIFSYFDGIVPSEDVFQFYNSYKGPKDFCQIFQTHNQDRSQDLFNQAMMWLISAKRRNIQSANQNKEYSYDIKKDKGNQSTIFC